MIYCNNNENQARGSNEVSKNEKNGNIQRHNLVLLSLEPVARSGALGWNATDRTQSLCPCRVATQVAADKSADSRHNLVLPSSKEPVARSGALGWNATERT